MFVRVQTIIGNDSNAAQYQLANLIDSAVTCTRILAEHPEWEWGPHQLNLQSWPEQAGDVSAKDDHINPASWCGDVSAKNVVLKTCWFAGHCCAEKELKEAGWETPFEQMV